MSIVQPAPGFYAWGADQTFFVSQTGEVWQLVADVRPNEVRVPALPAGAEPFGPEIPSMLLRMAARLGLAPPSLRGLSDDAVDLLDEMRWDSQLGRGLGAEAIAELVGAGLVAPQGEHAGLTAEGLAQLEALSESVSGRSFKGGRA